MIFHSVTIKSFKWNREVLECPNIYVSCCRREFPHASCGSYETSERVSSIVALCVGVCTCMWVGLRLIPLQINDTLQICYKNDSVQNSTLPLFYEHEVPYMHTTWTCNFSLYFPFYKSSDIIFQSEFGGNTKRLKWPYEFLITLVTWCPSYRVYSSHNIQWIKPSYVNLKTFQIKFVTCFIY